MPFAAPLQTNFTAGELSPRLFARVDLEKYFSGAAEIENMVVLPHGGVTRRAGTHFVDQVKDSAKFTRLIPFELSAALSYALQFGEGYIRFHTNHATVIDGRAIVNGTFDTDLSGWVDGSTGTGTAAWNAGLVDLSGGAGGVGLLYQERKAPSSNNFYTITVDVFDGIVNYAVGTTPGGNEITNGTVAVGVDQTFQFQPSTNETLYISFGNPNNDIRRIDNVRIDSPIYELVAPYQESDLDDIKYTQTSTALFLVHPDWAPRRLTREAVNQWKLEVLDFLDGPYLDTNTTSTTLTASAASGSVTVTASSTVGINNDQGFLSTDSGRLIRMSPTTPAWGWGVITAVGSPTSVTVQVRENVPTAATTFWRLGAWSDTTGYPSAATFFEQRLVFANTATEPDRFWMSQSGTENVESFSPTATDGSVNADNAITYQIADDQVNAIYWLSGGDVLVIGTAASEYIVRPSNNSAGVAPDDIEVKRQTTRGSDKFVRPIRIDQQVIYLQRAGRKLRNFFFQLEINGYISDDITIIAEHITESLVLEMAYQQEPDSLIWCIRGDGRLVGLTYQLDQEVIGWHQHKIGGTQAGDAFVESIIAIPTPQNTADEAWMIVARTINGITRRYVEYLEQPFSLAQTSQVDAYFVDSGLTYNGAPSQTFSGLDHLEGETVSVLADGAVHPDVAVTGGQITLTKPASVVAVGLKYQSIVRSLSPEAGGGPGPALHKTKRIHKIWFDFYETLGAQYGVDGVDVLVIPFRKGGDPMDNPPPIFTGIKEISLPKGYDRRIEPFALQEQPLPMTLLAKTFGMATNE